LRGTQHGAADDDDRDRCGIADRQLRDRPDENHACYQRSRLEVVGEKAAEHAADRKQPEEAATDIAELLRGEATLVHSIMGTATRPSTILSRKFISLKTASSQMMVQVRPFSDTSLITIPERSKTARQNPFKPAAVSMGSQSRSRFCAHQAM
jgi:hypothetical protein